MTDRLHLLPKHRRMLEAMLHEHLPDVEVWAYGSRVNGRSHDGSDLDLVLRGPGLTGIPLGQLAGFEEAVRDSNIPFLVEARDWARLPERFHREIERGYVVLTRKERRRTGSDWPTVRLGDCIQINDSTYTPSEAWPLINYLDTGNITENRIAEIQRLIAGKDKIPSRARRKVEPGDIVYSTVRPNQRHFGLMKTVPENFLASTGFAVMRGKNDVACTDFIYWFLAQDRVVERLHTIAEHSTSAYPSIRPTDLKQLMLNLPPLPEQRAIAQILGTLDDKIELNRRMNETLEAMARAIFKDWFVDFGPTRAKAEGRAPYLAPEIWDLFPNALDDEGKPLGWTKLTVSDIATQHKATVSPTAMPDTIFEHYSIPAYDRGQVPALDLGLEIRSNKTELPEESVLLSKLNPEIPRVWLPNPKSDDPQICSTEFLVYVPNPGFDRSLLYAVFSASSFRQILQNMVTGTSKSHQRVLPNSVLEMTALCGETRVIQAFTDTVGCLLKQLLANRSESTNLTQTRDLLLPKLVSGEIRVAEAEKVAEAVA